jgi:hypothetical protein
MKTNNHIIAHRIIVFSSILIIDGGILTLYYGALGYTWQFYYIDCISKKSKIFYNFVFDNKRRAFALLLSYY